MTFPMRSEAFLRPGDGLLYGPKGIYGWIIALKTWHGISHCEGYEGDGQCVASRDGLGVNRYPLRTEGLSCILRPSPGIDTAKAAAWFATVRGQKYDWLGLLRFAWFRSIGAGNNGKMFCSEFLTRWYRAGGLEPFHRNEDADAIVPADFLQSAAFDHFVVRNGLVYPEAV